MSVSAIDPQFDVSAPRGGSRTSCRAASAAVAAQGSAVWVAPCSGCSPGSTRTPASVLQHIDPNAGPAAIARRRRRGLADRHRRQQRHPCRPDRTADPDRGRQRTRARSRSAAGGVWVADSLDDSVVRIDPATQSVTHHDSGGALAGRQSLSAPARCGSPTAATAPSPGSTRAPTRCSRRSRSAAARRRSRSPAGASG